MKNCTLRILAAVIVMVALALSVKAQTYVSGGIYANTTWAKANSPYIVTDNVVVFPGFTLTIEPGVTVKFEDTKSLEIRQATLIAQGTASDSITFTSNSATPTPGIWDKIYLNDVIDTLNFNYCNFKYANYGIQDDSYLPSINWIINSNFNYNKNGITISTSNYDRMYYIKFCNFKNNTNYGIQGTYGVEVDSCNFFNNGNVGINNINKLTNSTILNSQTGIIGANLISNCNISKNQNGISQVSNITNNIIDSNSVVGITNSSSFIFNNKITYNGTGINVTSDGLKIEWNIFENNNIGIKLNYFNNSINCNKICNNTAFDLYYNVAYGNNTSISNNYWCSNDSSIISSHIYDGYDNVSLGLVTFLPIDTIQCYLAGPPLPVPTISGTSIICPYNPNEYYYTQSGTNYVWTVSLGNTVVSGGTSTDGFIEIQWNVLGNQTISVNYTDKYGNSALIPTVFNVYVYPAPAPTITGQNIVCENSTGNIYTTEAGKTNYVWTVSAGGTITAGGTSADTTVTITWNTTGAQTVKVNYTDICGNSAPSATVFNVTVNNCAPSCTSSFSFTPGINNSVTFINNSVGNVNTWYWDFGDSAMSLSKNPFHTYQSSGVYYVCLTASEKDSAGNVLCSDTSCQNVFVGVQPSFCQANYFSFLNPDGITFQFINASTVFDSTGLTMYSWDFGDGTNSFGINPMHVYADSGIYNVCLSVFHTYTFNGIPDTCFNIFCNTITVNNNSSTSKYSISGTVHAGNNPASSAAVVLFNATYNYYNAVDYQLVSNGNFMFDSVVPGNYILYAIPDISVYPDYLPTYLGDVLYWQNAWILNVPANITGLDINLVDIDSAAGHLKLTGDKGIGSISGTVTFDNPLTYETNIFGQAWFGKGGGSKGIAGRNIPVLLKGIDGTVLNWALANESGDYTFTSLDLQQYTVNAEKASLKSVSPVISLTSANPDISNVNINIGVNNIVTSVELMQEYESLNSLVYFPNPVKEELNISFNLAKQSQVDITLYDIAGQVIKKYSNSLAEGANKITFDASDFSAGLYIARVFVDNSNAANFKIVK